MVDAQVALAELSLNGTGGPRDHEASLALFRRAAELKHLGAMFAMGAMLGGGHDVQEDRVEARRWYRLAAERGHAHAQLMLGRFLSRGLGGDKLLPEARGWLQRAEAQGVAEAAIDLAAIAAEEAEQHPAAG